MSARSEKFYRFLDGCYRGLYYMFYFVEPLLAGIVGVQGLIAPVSFIDVNFGPLSYRIPGLAALPVNHPLLIAMVHLSSLVFIGIALIIFSVMSTGYQPAICRMFIALLVPDVLNFYTFFKFYSFEAEWHTLAYVNVIVSLILFVGRIIYLLIAYRYGDLKIKRF